SSAESRQRSARDVAADLEAARHTPRYGSLVVRIVERLEKGDDLALPAAAHVQLTQQRVPRRGSDVRIQSALAEPGSAPPSSAAAEADAAIKVEHLAQRREHAVVHVWTRQSDVAQRRRAERIGARAGVGCFQLR